MDQSFFAATNQHTETRISKSSDPLSKLYKERRAHLPNHQLGGDVSTEETARARKRPQPKLQTNTGPDLPQGVQLPSAADTSRPTLSNNLPQSSFLKLSETYEKVIFFYGTLTK